MSSEFIVNTLSAGSGALSVTIDGPSKVQLDCRECPEGHVVTYTPMAPGNYLIAIKYGGPQHIVGSPFKAKVTGECPRVLKEVHLTQSMLQPVQPAQLWWPFTFPQCWQVADDRGGPGCTPHTFHGVL